ncbi:MAG: phosphoribosylglycinamide formyltransferase [Clostridia bacterium]|nr:phosphoribosylglycinamide formyltransferase [Clostridia bacterium]
MKKIAVLVSGGGTNLQAILDAQASGIIKSGKVCCVISSSPNAFALERAKNAGVPGECVRRKDYESVQAFDEALLNTLEKYNADIIVLAGFLCILGESIIRAYPNKIINVHPSLIPSFCGDGFYGLMVHEKALEYGVKVTGATVHFVNEITDGGAIILQKAVNILPEDDAESLQKRVMKEAEHIILPQAVELLCADKIKVDGRKVEIIA